MRSHTCASLYAPGHEQAWALLSLAEHESSDSRQYHHVHPFFSIRVSDVSAHAQENGIHHLAAPSSRAHKFLHHLTIIEHLMCPAMTCVTCRAPPETLPQFLELSLLSIDNESWVQERVCEVNPPVAEACNMQPGWTMWDLYQKFWQPFGGLLVDMERAGMLVDRQACIPTSASHHAAFMALILKTILTAPAWAWAWKAVHGHVK